MGKTTLIRTLMGYVRPASGTVTWQGHPVTGAPPERMARSGSATCPRARHLPNLSVRENLLVSARAGADGGADWDLRPRARDLPRLAERLANGGHQLSGGEQQMLSIGRALMTNPTLMILDESDRGPGAADRRRDLARDRHDPRQRGISTLIVDRNCARRARHTDRAVVMEKGRIVLAGSSGERRRSPTRWAACSAYKAGRARRAEEEPAP